MILISFLLTFFVQTSSQKTMVEKQIESLRLLMITPDKKGLETIAHKELSYGHSSGRVETQKEFIETLISGKSVFKKIRFQDQHIDIVGNTAVVRHTLLADTLDGGVVNSIKIHVVLVWVKQNEEWKLLTRQAVKIV